MTATTKGRGNSKSKRATPPNVNKPWPIKNAVNFLLAQLHYSHAPSLCQNAPMQLITTTQSNIATNKAKITLDCLFILHSEQDSHLKAQKTSFCFHNSHHRQFMESLWKAVLWHQVYASNSRKKKKKARQWSSKNTTITTENPTHRKSEWKKSQYKFIPQEYITRTYFSRHKEIESVTSRAQL